MKSTVLPSLVALVVLVLAMTIEAKESSAPVMRRHHAKVARAVSENMERDVLQKRSFSGSATWYSFGKGALGACGQGLDPNDYVVALNQGQYGSLNAQSPHCGKTITISNGVKSTQARIMDACPLGTQCHFGALDMSQSLFEFFNPLGVGVFPITWWFGGGSSGGSGGSSSSSSSSASSTQSNNDDSAKKAAAKKQADQDAANKAAAAKKAAEEKKQAAAAEKKKEAAAAEKKKEEAAAKKKAAAEKKKAAAAAKKAKEAKVANAQEQNIASFGEIMSALNDMVVEALDTEKTS